MNKNSNVLVRNQFFRFQFIPEIYFWIRKIQNFKFSLSTFVIHKISFHQKEVLSFNWVQTRESTLSDNKVIYD